MTYVSRKNRIIVSRWPDECNFEYIIQAHRKRSDGRLKNYTSCDDLRAWINDNCIKYEYFSELMTRTEFIEKPPYALYGRYIPVPILFKLIDSGKSGENDGKESSDEKEEQDNLNRIEWEKNQAEKNLLDCTLLLNTAIRKLEKVENIVDICNSETELIRSKEIKNAFSRAKTTSNCGFPDCHSSSFSSSNFSENNSMPDERCAKDSLTCNELMRKISQLMKKLKEVQACRCEIIHQIQKAERCTPSNQVKELFNREDQDLIKKLQRELEKLIIEKGRLLSEICNVLNSLNSLKISSKSSVNSKRGRRSSNGKFGKCSGCECGCREISENYESTDTEDREFPESLYACDDLPTRIRNDSCDFERYPERLNPEFSDQEPEKLCPEENAFEFDEIQEMNSFCTNEIPRKNPETLEQDLGPNDNTESQEQAVEKSKVKFVCEGPPCGKDIYSDDLSAFESSLTPEQKAIIAKAVKNIENQRPSTTPTTKREKKGFSLKSQSTQNSAKQNPKEPKKESCRQVKSDTMLKEFEETLKNYERRLNNLNTLECKLEDLKQKSSEVYSLRKKLAKVKAKAKKQRVADKEKYNSEITRLCSENWELKKHVQQLTAKSNAQIKKIQNLKCTMMKVRGLECEAEELKKELSEYREGFEHQRKCIYKWESVVAMQTAEIENLKNHIRKLTAVKDESQCNIYSDKKCIQRSRSYSPEQGKGKPRNIRRKSSREFRPMVMEEEEHFGCYCREDPQMEGKKNVHLKNSDRNMVYSYQRNY